MPFCFKTLVHVRKFERTNNSQNHFDDQSTVFKTLLTEMIRSFSFTGIHCDEILKILVMQHFSQGFSSGESSFGKKKNNS